MRLQNAPDSLPKNKVIASTLAAAIASLGLQYLKGRGVDLPPETQTGVISLITLALGYLVPDRA